MALSCGITKAGPDHPIYKNGWSVGETKSPGSYVSGPAKELAKAISELPPLSPEEMEEAIQSLMKQIGSAETGNTKPE